MALELFIPYRNNAGDATLSIISRFSNFLRGGFVQSWLDTTENVITEDPAPLIVGVAGQLKVNVTPGSGIGYVAISRDGMICRETSATHQLTVTAGTKYYIVLRLKYVSSVGGEIAEWQALTAADYASSPYKSQMLIAGTIDSIVGVDASTGVVSYSERHRIEGLFDSRWRPSVSTFASLPTIVDDPFLKTGDCIIVRDTLTFYGWNGTAWVAVGGTAALHVALGRDRENQLEYLRAMHSSGILAGDTNDDTALGAGELLGLHEHPSTGTRLGVGEIKALINGHFIRTRTLDIDLSAKPGVGTRYDLVYMEVYRLEIASPSTVTYTDASGGTRTGAQMTAALEELTNSAAHDATSFDVTAIEVTHDNKYVVTVVSLRTVDNILIGGMEDPYDMVALGAPVNSGANPWAFSAAYSDPRLWKSTLAAAYDGVAWGMPLYTIIRTSVENPAAASGILEFRSGDRYIFPVYPVANVGPYSRAQIHARNAALVAARQQLPSGFLHMQDYEVSAGLDMEFADDAHMMVKGRQVRVLQADTAVTLAASAGASGRRDLVVAECRFVAHPDDSGTVGRTVHRLGEYAALASFGAPYMREMYLQIDYTSWDSGLVEDVEEAMAAAGYAKETDDGGLWSVAVGTYDPRHNFFSKVYALPIALVHRLNSAAFNLGTNPNGGSSRPDGLVYTAIDQDTQVVQCWHLTGAQRHTIKTLFESSLDRLLRGQLGTLMTRHPSHGGVAGKKMLFADAIAGGAIAGTTLLSAAPDGYRHCWSEADDEVRPYGATFTPENPYADAIFTWTPGAPGVLRVQAPSGMAIYVSSTAAPTQGLHLTVYDAAGPPADIVMYDSLDTATTAGTVSNVVINASDTFGYPTDLSCDVTYVGTDDLHIYFWMIHKRSASDVQHQNNEGLSAVPDTIRKVTWGVSGVGNDAAVAPMVVGLVKNINGAAVVFNTTDLAAAISEGGNPTFQGVLGLSVEDNRRGAYVVSSIVVSNAQDTVTVTFSAPIVNKDVFILVAYQTSTVDRWIEVSRGARSVTAFHDWYDIDWTGQATAGRYLLTPTGTFAMRHVCLMWRVAGANPWSVIPEDQYGVTINEGSDAVYLESLAAGYQDGAKEYRLVVGRLRAPANAGEDIIIYYTGSAYQGLSGKNGVTPASYLADRLQGEVLFSGKSFLTTAGYRGYYLPPTSTTTASTPSSAYDQEYNTTTPNRALALVTAGQGFWRGRHQSLSTADASYSYYGVSRYLNPHGLDCIIDRLPWPDWAGGPGLAIYTPGDGAAAWSGVQPDPHDLDYQTILLGGQSAVILAGAGGFLLWVDDAFSADQVGARRPVAGLVVEYGDDYSPLATEMEANSFVDGTRGVMVTHWAWDAAATAIQQYVADGVGYLAFGNVEGLLHSEMDSGICGWSLLETLPTYLHPGFPFQLHETTWDGVYYGGHGTCILSSVTDEVYMQVAGGPKEISGLSPSAPYAPRVGGVFDAFYLIGRPLLPTRV